MRQKCRINTHYRVFIKKILRFYCYLTVFILVKASMDKQYRSV